MKRIAVALAVIVAALGLVACGGGGSSSTSSTDGSSVDPAEVARGLALYHEYQHLEGLVSKGIHRLAMAEEYGTPQEVESLEEAEDELKAEAKAVIEEAEEQSIPVQRAVTKLLEEEE
jgi:hypothetical protein